MNPVTQRFNTFSMFAGPNDPPSSMKDKINATGDKLKEMAAADGVSIQDAAIRVLKNSDPELDAYIRSRNEVPVSTITGRILQAGLIRMEDISTVARAAGITDTEALSNILEGESEIVDLNNSEKSKILTPSTQCALSIVWKTLYESMADTYGCKTIGDALDIIRGTMATPKDHNANGTWGNIPDNFDLGGIYSSDTSPSTNNQGDDSSSIWDLLSNVIKNSGSIAASVQSIGNTVSNTAKNVSNTIGTTGSNIGAASISQYAKDNWIMILSIILIVVLIIVIAIRARK